MAPHNRLATEVSPYLVQHAQNPVAWWPWSPEAFAQAKADGKPVLISIGYSACHWCHVMAHESFEDVETAALMNDLFVNIKVDREERPDVDHVFMEALHSLGEQGGWPLTIFADADGKPFWGGTYFPKTSRYGRPSFMSVLRNVATAYATRRGDIDQNTAAILSRLHRNEPAGDRGIGLAFLDDIAPRIRDIFDPVHGGPRGAPKFPNPPILEFLWRAADRTGDESIRAPVLTTLERLCRGGIFDHVGGGFARYSVDERWLVPHFEKMLYDNAQILPMLALAATHSGSNVLARAARRTVTWLFRDMTLPSGAFAASLDADSINPDGHAEEGAFYVWKPGEIAAVLGTGAGDFCREFDITAGGNFEGLSIPNQLHRQGLDDSAITAHDDALEQLRVARARRAPPGLDDKVLADWNGLMIAGLVRAADILDEPEWLSAAERAFAAVVIHLGNESILAHAYRAGKRTHPGFAADHAAMALAALTLYESTGNPGYLRQGETWARTLLTHYQTEPGPLAMTIDTAADLPVRPAPTADDAVPNANGIAAEVLVRLFGLTGDPVWLEAADDIIGSCVGHIAANPFGHAALLNALDLRLRRADITLAAPESHPLGQAANLVPFPNRTLSLVMKGADRPLTVAGATSPEPHVLVCADGTCSLPITEVDEFRTRIEKAVHKGRPDRKQGTA